MCFMEHFTCSLIRGARVHARVMHFLTQGRLGSRAGLRVFCQVFLRGVGRSGQSLTLCKYSNNDVSINTVPLSILKLYAKNQTWFVFVYLLWPTSLTKTKFLNESYETPQASSTPKKNNCVPNCIQFGWKLKLLDCWKYGPWTQGPGLRKKTTAPKYYSDVSGNMMTKACSSGATPPASPSFAPAHFG